MSVQPAVSSELLKLMETFHLSYVVLIEHGNLDLEHISNNEKERLKIAFTNFKKKLGAQQSNFNSEDDVDAINVIISSCSAIINEL